MFTDMAVDEAARRQDRNEDRDEAVEAAAKEGGEKEEMKAEEISVGAKVVRRGDDVLGVVETVSQGEIGGTVELKLRGETSLFEFTNEYLSGAEIVDGIIFLPPVVEGRDRCERSRLARKRVEMEKAELKERLLKLRRYMGTYAFGLLSPDMQEYMKRQADAMGEYLSCLEHRLAIWDRTRLSAPDFNAVGQNGNG